jgi:hypothetical protein
MVVIADCRRLQQLLLLSVCFALVSHSSGGARAQDGATPAGSQARVSAPPSWQWCVSNIPRFYIRAPAAGAAAPEEAPNARSVAADAAGGGADAGDGADTAPSAAPAAAAVAMVWTDEARRLCGFGPVTLATLRREAFFPTRAPPSTGEPSAPGEASSARAALGAAAAAPAPGEGEGEGGSANADDSTSQPTIAANVTRAAAAPADRTVRHTFLGDSTALRAFAEAVNEFMPPMSVTVGKVRQSPPQLVTRLGEWASAGPPAARAAAQAQPPDAAAQQRFVEMRFGRLVYISQWPAALRFAFAQPTNGGLVAMSLGNWDLNWKLNPDLKIPGFRFRRNLWGASAYWSSNAERLFAELESVLAGARVGEAPIVVVKEQYLPNCAAKRFEPKRVTGRRSAGGGGGGGYVDRQCGDLLRPVVVPLYRRVVAALAWSLDVPVVPVDFLTEPRGASACRLGDGIHLDAACMRHEQQLIWNVYLLLRRRGVRQGRRTSNSSRGATEAPGARGANATDRMTGARAVDKDAFWDWWCARPWSPCEGVNVSLAKNPPIETRAPRGARSSPSPSPVPNGSAPPSAAPDGASATTGAPAFGRSARSVAPDVSDVFAIALVVFVPILAYALLQLVARPS